jgi:DNA polymerase III sliding clamp (beta) subunit (PCNA family)
MEFTAETKALAIAAARCASVADMRSTSPICRTTRVVAANGMVTLTATNISTMTRVDISVAADVTTEGSVCIDADDLARWAKSLPDGAQAAVSPHSEKEWSVLAKVGRRRHAFGYMPSDTFPELRDNLEMLDGTTVKVNCAQLAGAISAALKAAARSDPREYLCGVGFDQGFAVGTNTHVLIATPVDPELSGILHRDNSRAVLEALRDADTAELMADGDRFMLTADNVTVSQAGVAVEYPDWTKLVKEGSPLADFSRDELLEALDAATLSGGGEVEITARNQELFISHARARQTGKAEGSGRALFQTLGDGEAAADADTHAEGTIKLNADYLRAALSALPVGSVSWATDDSLGPGKAPICTFRPTQTDAEGQPFAMVVGLL